MAASGAFLHASLQGLTTFAPPREAALVELLDGRSGILVAINAEKIARHDPAIAEVTSLHLGYPDGVGAVLALRRRGIRAHRMPGADLWLTIIARYGIRRSFYLIGGTEEVIQAVAEKLTNQNPEMRLWTRNGYVSEGELQHLEHELCSLRPDFVFVAMGSPKQEILMRRLYSIHPAVYVGLGGSFDIYAGTKSRAPRWLQQIGLEGAYRLLREPRRLDQLPTLFRFVALLATGRL